MTDVDRLLVAATREPDDGTVRLVASDAIREWGDPVLAHAVEDDETGPVLLNAVKETSKRINLPVSVLLVWCQYHVLSRILPPTIMAPHVTQEDMEQLRRNWEEAIIRPGTIRTYPRTMDPTPFWIAPPYPDDRWTYTVTNTSGGPTQ